MKNWLPKFYLIDLIAFMAATAAGLLGAKFANRSILGFSVGALAVLMTVGLLQQISNASINQPTSIRERLARVVVLSLIVAGIWIGVGLVCFPAQSWLGYVICYFSFFLAALTSPWMTIQETPTGNRWSYVYRIGLSVLILTGLGLFLIYVIQHLCMDVLLTDIAIQGIRYGMHQPSMGNSDDSIDYARSDPLFQEFLAIQMKAWPSLLFAMVLFIAFLRSRLSFRKTKVVIGIVVAAFVIPAIYNVIWMASGRIAQLFPEFLIAYREQPNTKPLWGILPTVLVAIYLCTRRRIIAEKVEGADRPHSAPRLYVNDSWIVGFLIIAIGIDQILSILQFQIYVELLWYAIVDPELSLPLLMLPFGAIWVARRMFCVRSEERWPRVSREQVQLFPWLLFLLVALIVTAIPFGIACFHWQSKFF